MPDVIGKARTKAALFDQLMPRILAGYVDRMVEQHVPGPRPAASAIGRKDNALALEAAGALGLELPLAQFLRDQVISPR